jgi:hypothetical protein
MSLDLTRNVKLQVGGSTEVNMSEWTYYGSLPKPRSNE